MKKIIKTLFLISWVISWPLSVISCSSNIHSKTQLEHYTLNALNDYWTNTDPIFKPNASLSIQDFKSTSFKEHSIFKNKKIYYDINFDINISNLTAFKYIDTPNKISSLGAESIGEFQINLKQPKSFNWLDTKKPMLVYNLKNFSHVINTTYNVFIGSTNDFTMVLNGSTFGDFYDYSFNYKKPKGGGNEYLKLVDLTNSNIKLLDKDWYKIAMSIKLDTFSSSDSYYAAIHVVNKKVVYTNMKLESTYHDFSPYKNSHYVPLIAFQDPNNNKHLFLNKDILIKLNTLYHAPSSKKGLNNWNLTYISNYLKEYEFKKASNINYWNIANCLLNFVQNKHKKLNKFLKINQSQGYYGIWIQFNEHNNYLASEINANHQINDQNKN